MSENNSFFQKNKKLILEFLRYVIVGGISAVVDMAVNNGLVFYVFGGETKNMGAVAISVTAGFIVGLAVNFILSNIFVFNAEEQKEKGKTAGAFFIYAAVGVIGYILTAVLTLLGTLVIGEEGIWYIILTVGVKGIVLIWNYIGRKIFVYKGK